MKTWLKICGSFLLAILTGCQSARPPEIAVRPHFRLMSYNVNWGGPAPELAVAAIRREQPDVVCLQETNAEWERYLRGQLSKDYPHMAFRNSKLRAGGGLGFLSKVPMKEVAYIPSNTDWFDGWIMSFATSAGSVQVLNVHLRPPVSDRGSFGASGYLFTDDDRQREIKRFHAQARGDLPLIIAGDFNDGENSGVLRWLKTKGMQNALPEFDSSTPTWQWRTSLITLKRRMDHIVYPPDFYCYDAKAIRTGASDHYPVVAVFGRRSEASRTVD
jgi:endonuclease/exonuclease/phosphatase (EEP) superfamily protein YafD